MRKIEGLERDLFDQALVSDLILDVSKNTGQNHAHYDALGCEVVLVGVKDLQHLVVVVPLGNHSGHDCCENLEDAFLLGDFSNEVSMDRPCVHVILEERWSGLPLRIQLDVCRGDVMDGIHLGVPFPQLHVIKNLGAPAGKERCQHSLVALKADDHAGGVHQGHDIGGRLHEPIPEGRDRSGDDDQGDDFLSWNSMASNASFGGQDPALALLSVQSWHLMYRTPAEVGFPPSKNRTSPGLPVVP